MQKALLVAYNFAPSKNTESYITTRFARGLDKLGWHLTVLTIYENLFPERKDEQLAKLLPEHARIVRTFTLEKLLHPRIFSLLAHLGLFTPAFAWYPHGLAAGKRILNDDSFDIIYSRAADQISNVIALALKRCSGLPWVAHFGDPWVDNPYTKFSRCQWKVSNILERLIIENADGLEFVSQQMADAVMAKYPLEYREKVAVIPHCFDSVEYTEVKTIEKKSQKLRIVHAGLLYGIRSPLPLFKALSSLLDKYQLSDLLEVIFIGGYSEKYLSAARELGVDNMVEFYGEKSRRETWEISSSADVFLLIDAPGKGNVFLPSKLIEYMPLSKPILGITPPNGASADVLRQLGCPAVDIDDIAGIADKIECIISLHKSRQSMLPKQFIEAARNYDISIVAKDLNDLLTATIRKCKRL